jgi:hypothetical protein
MIEIGLKLGSERSLHLLDGIAEKLIICVWDAPYKFPEKAGDIKKEAII